MHYIKELRDFFTINNTFILLNVLLAIANIPYGQPVINVIFLLIYLITQKLPTKRINIIHRIFISILYLFFNICYALYLLELKEVNQLKSIILLVIFLLLIVRIIVLPFYTQKSKFFGQIKTIHSTIKKKWSDSRFASVFFLLILSMIFSTFIEIKVFALILFSILSIIRLITSNKQIKHDAVSLACIILLCYMVALIISNDFISLDNNYNNNQTNQFEIYIIFLFTCTIFIVTQLLFLQTEVLNRYHFRHRKQTFFKLKFIQPILHHLLLLVVPYTLMTILYSFVFVKNETIFESSMLELFSMMIFLIVLFSLLLYMINVLPQYNIINLNDNYTIFKLINYIPAYLKMHLNILSGFVFNILYTMLWIALFTLTSMIFVYETNTTNVMQISIMIFYTLSSAYFNLYFVISKKQDDIKVTVSANTYDCDAYLYNPTVFLNNTRIKEFKQPTVIAISVSDILNSLCDKHILLDHVILDYPTYAPIMESYNSGKKFNTEDNKVALLIINHFPKKRTIRLDDFRIYHQDLSTNSNYITKLSVTFDLVYISTEYYVVNLEIRKKVTLTTRKKTSNKKYVPLNNQLRMNYMKLISMYRHYSYDEYQKEFIKNESDPRKFIHYNGKYGTGKSTYQLHWISYHGYKPIPISLWSENYRNEILYMVNNRIKQFLHKTYAISVFNTQHLKALAFVLATAIVSTVMLNIENPSIKIANIIALHFSIIDPHQLFWIDAGIFVFLFLVLYILSYLFSCLLVIKIVTLKTNSTEYLNDYFIANIKKNVNKSKGILIFEDIDRMEQSDIDKVFRLIDNLNNAFKDSDRIIGVIGYDTKLMNEKYQNSIPKNLHKDTINKVAINMNFKIGYHEYLAKCYYKKIKNYYNTYINLIMSDELSNFIYKNSSNKNMKISSFKLTERELSANINFRDIVPIINKMSMFIDELLSLNKILFDENNSIKKICENTKSECDDKVKALHKQYSELNNYNNSLSMRNYIF